MKTLLIIWHSRTGAAQQMAAAAGTVPHGNSVRIRLCEAAATTLADVLSADGLLFVTPEMLGSMAGAMKTCFERCYYPALGQLNGRPYGLMVAAGSDGTGAVRDIRRIATGWRLSEVVPPLIVSTNAQSAEAIAAPKIVGPTELARCAEMGSALAEGLALGIF